MRRDRIDAGGYNERGRQRPWAAGWASAPPATTDVAVAAPAIRPRLHRGHDRAPRYTGFLLSVGQRPGQERDVGRRILAVLPDNRKVKRVVQHVGDVSEPLSQNLDNNQLHAAQSAVPVFEAIDLNVSAPVITESLIRRIRSREQNNFTDRMLSIMRNAFGGHAVKKD